MKDAFASCHPIINFSYFCLLIALSVCFPHPLILPLSFAGALAFYLWLCGRRALRFCLCFLLPIMAAAAIINPLFNHRGVTIIGRLMDNPLTLESILYGAAAGLMLGAALLWFACYGAVMTSDKFIHLFGRILPALSLIFSMVLRFAPRLTGQLHVIAEARSGLGLGRGAGGGLAKGVKNGLNTLSAMTTWALENAVDTADSMRARGYGLPGRSSFSLFRFDARDGLIAILLAACAAPALYAAAAGRFTAQYFPYFKRQAAGAPDVAFYCAFGFLSFFPLLLSLFEAARWRSLERRRRKSLL
jgi:energy-coupling factor transport system permease protein